MVISHISSDSSCSTDFHIWKKKSLIILPIMSDLVLPMAYAIAQSVALLILSSCMCYYCCYMESRRGVQVMPNTELPAPGEDARDDGAEELVEFRAGDENDQAAT